MALRDLLSSKTDETKEYYWALLIEPSWVQAGVWRVVEEKTQIISTSPVTSWELEEELVEAVDTALSASVQDFPEEDEEPKRVVFGVVSNWVSQGDIKQEYLEKIKNICSKLTLEPLGFVVLPEAIAHYIKSEEGSPLSAVVLGISKDEVEISIFKLGKLTGTTQVARSLSIVDDVVEGLARFGQKDPSPTRFVLYDGREGELEEIKQMLLKANWEDYENVKFLHTPKVETISPNLKVYAVSLAGASELADVTSVSVSKENLTGEKELDERKVNLGKVSELDKTISLGELGFALEEDVAESRGKAYEKAKEGESYEYEMAKEGEKKRTGHLAKPDLFSILRGAKDRLSKSFVMKLKPSIAYDKRTFILGVAIFAAVIIALFAFYWFYPRATVTIYLSTKKLDEKVTVTIDPDISSPDLSQRVLPGEVLTTSVSGDKTKSTSGTKIVGDKAKGEVILYRVGNQLTLPSGTLISGPDNLDFTLDDSVNVASGSAGTAGTAKAKVTASNIGAEYNLAGGSTFTVGNYSVSDIEAKSESSFSGGSSREISAVSLDDQEILEEELTAELKERAREELLEKVATNKIFIDETLSGTPSSRTFSDKVGDEADTVKLTLELGTRAIAVGKEALYKLSEEILRDKIPEGFVLRSEQIEASFEYKGEVAGRFELEADLSANLLPEIDPSEVATKIVGRYPPLVEDYLLNEIPGFVKAEISFNKPRFPGRLGTLPRQVKKIEVVIAAQK